MVAEQVEGGASSLEYRSLEAVAPKLDSAVAATVTEVAVAVVVFVDGFVEAVVLAVHAVVAAAASVVDVAAEFVASAVADAVAPVSGRWGPSAGPMFAFSAASLASQGQRYFQ